MRRLLLAIVLVGAASVDSLSSGPSGIVYAIPVALAAILDGWAGGLTAALLSSVSVYVISRDQTAGTSIVESVLLLVLACVAALTGGRERKLRRHYQEVAEQLSNVYEKVQANFE